MIVLKLHRKHHKTGELTYDSHTQARQAIVGAGVDGDDATRLLHRELFAFIGVHPATGDRFALWRGRDRLE